MTDDQGEIDEKGNDDRRGAAGGGSGGEGVVDDERLLELLAEQPQHGEEGGA